MSVPSLFAPNVISTPDSGEAFGTLTPDGREFYFTKHHDFARHHIMVSRLAQGQWSQPALVPISGVYNDREPRLSPDGRRPYFSSNRLLTSGDSARAAISISGSVTVSRMEGGAPHDTSTAP